MSPNPNYFWLFGHLVIDWSLVLGHWSFFEPLNLLTRLQNLPANIRKLILWLIVILVGLGLLFLWGKNFGQKIKSFQSQKFLEELKLPKFQEELRGLEMPKMGEEELKKIEEMMKEAEKEKSQSPNPPDSIEDSRQSRNNVQSNPNN